MEDDDYINPNLIGLVFDADGRVVSTPSGNTSTEVVLKTVALGQGATYKVPVFWKVRHGL